MARIAIATDAYTATAMPRKRATTAAASAGSRTPGAMPLAAAGPFTAPARMTPAPERRPAKVHTIGDSDPTLMPSSDARSLLSATARPLTAQRFMV